VPRGAVLLAAVPGFVLVRDSGAQRDSSRLRLDVIMYQAQHLSSAEGLGELPWFSGGQGGLRGSRSPREREPSSFCSVTGQEAAGTG